MVVSDELRRIARAARFDHPFHWQVGQPVDGIEHLQHRQPFAVAAVHHQIVGWVRYQPMERRDVRCREVGDVDIVADAGAVRRRIVIAVNTDVGPLPDRGLAGDLDDVGRALADLP